MASQNSYTFIKSEDGGKKAFKFPLMQLTFSQIFYLVMKFIENILHNRERTAFLNKASYGNTKLNLMQLCATSG